MTEPLTAATIEELEDCYECGEGFVRTVDDDGNEVEYECEACHGTGIVRSSEAEGCGR